MRVTVQRVADLTDTQRAVGLGWLAVTHPDITAALFEALADYMVAEVVEQVRLDGSLPEPDPDRCKACGTHMGPLVSVQAGRGPVHWYCADIDACYQRRGHAEVTR